MKLRWGIASAGKISHDFVDALTTLPDDEHQVIAVATSNSLERAEEFAKKFEIPKSYGSYQDLAEDKDIDVVYVGTLHPQHYEVSMLMLENGKHVLCEKPLCMNERQARKLITYAERKKLFLMEAIWSRFFPAYQYIRNQIKTGVLGDIKEVEVSFGQNLTEIDRMTKKSMGGGTILDLGIYTIQISQWAIQEPPKSIKAEGGLSSEGVDEWMKAELIYSSGAVAKIHTSCLERLENTATIKGTKAKIILKNFWSPTTIADIDGQEKTWALPEGKYPTNFENSIGLRYEAEEVRKCIMENKIQSDSVSHNESLLIARIEDEIRKQIGVIYEEDKGN